jgi:hypothetical protein
MMMMVVVVVKIFIVVSNDNDSTQLIDGLNLLIKDRAELGKLTSISIATSNTTTASTV